MDKIRLLIAEDNVEMGDILENYFEMIEEISLCGTARNGEDALKMISSQVPDVVLLDLIMPRLDGLSVLERLKECPPTKPPHVIVTSAIGMENVTSRALELGASYYVIKPYNLEDLLRRVRMFSRPTAATADSDAHSCIRRLVKSIGVTSNVVAFSYIIDAAELFGRTAAPCCITKEIYPEVARRHHTTTECVESAIRKTIARVHAANRPKLELVMGPLAKRPSNGQLLTALAEKAREQMHEKQGGLLC